MDFTNKNTYLAGNNAEDMLSAVLATGESFLILDPDGRLTRRYSGELVKRGYDVRTTGCFNPFAYVKDDGDIARLAGVICACTGTKDADGIREDMARTAVVALLRQEWKENGADASLPGMMKKLDNARLHDALIAYSADGAAGLAASPATLRSVCMSVAVRMDGFYLTHIENMTDGRDTLELDTLAEEKRAVFLPFDADIPASVMLGAVAADIVAGTDVRIICPASTYGIEKLLIVAKTRYALFSGIVKPELAKKCDTWIYTGGMDVSTFEFFLGKDITPCILPEPGTAIVFEHGRQTETVALP